MPSGAQIHAAAEAGAKGPSKKRACAGPRSRADIGPCRSDMAKPLEVQTVPVGLGGR